MILEIGFGGKKEYWNSMAVDREKATNPDIVANLEGGICFKDKSFDLVSASHVLEHINNFDMLMEEMSRILKPDGKLVVKVPYCQSHLAKHPYHVRFFSLNSFSRGWNMKYQKLFEVRERKFKMGITRYTNFLNVFNPIINLMPSVQEFFEVFIFSWFLPPQELEFVLGRV